MNNIETQYKLIGNFNGVHKNSFPEVNVSNRHMDVAAVKLYPYLLTAAAVTSSFDALAKNLL